MQSSKIFPAIFIYLLFFVTACGVKDPANLSNQSTIPEETTDGNTQIGDYVVEVFEDSKGNLWFGTLGKGVAQYDGQSLTYLTTKDGLSDNAVVSMAEDKQGNLWFGTHAGLSKYDGKTFINYTPKEGLCHPQVSHILIDRGNNLWITTWAGVCRFDGVIFSDFPLPKPIVDTPIYVETRDWVTVIMEDKEGNFWFGRSGYGATKYDVTTRKFTNFTKQEGLLSNCVQAIQEDKLGNIWIGTRVAERDNSDTGSRIGDGGLSQYNPLQGVDNPQFTHFPAMAGLSKSDVYSIYKDKKENLWIGTTGEGVYKYDGEKFINYQLKEDPTTSSNGVPCSGIQSILEDTKGNIWFGCSGGLFRLDGTGVVNVPKGAFG